MAMRALWLGEGSSHRGEFYSTEGIVLEPYPAQRSGPPVWIGRWGSKAGLKRTARLGDGWLASGYNTTPEGFADARGQLIEYLHAAGKDPHRFPNAIATMFFFATEEHAAKDELRQLAVFREHVAPAAST